MINSLFILKKYPFLFHLYSALQLNVIILTSQVQQLRSREVKGPNCSWREPCPAPFLSLSLPAPPHSVTCLYS